MKKYPFEVKKSRWKSQKLVVMPRPIGGDSDSSDFFTLSIAFLAAGRNRKLSSASTSFTSIKTSYPGFSSSKPSV